MPDRIAYIPLETYPEPVADSAILSALDLADAIGFGTHVSLFAVDIPPVASPLGGLLLDIDAMARVAEDRSRAECDRLQALIDTHARGNRTRRHSHRAPMMGTAKELATAESHYFDLVALPWGEEALSAQALAQSLVFGSGVPVVLVPPVRGSLRVDHIAVAWDGSRVATRALGDALRLLPQGGRITVVTVKDEKELGSPTLAETLAASLTARKYAADAMSPRLKGRTIAETLQDSALDAGAQLLAMGGFGHSRLRDFVLGGATRGVLARLRLPTLLAH